MLLFASLRVIQQNLRFSGRRIISEWLKKPLKTSVVLRSGLLSSSAVLFGSFRVRQGRCHSVNTRIDRAELDRRLKETEPTLPFDQLLRLILPHSLWLLAAVVGAFLAALLNIYTPLYLGELVDGISAIIKDPVRVGVSSLKDVASKLVIAYVAQAGLTFLYISCLTFIGERMARDLRNKLFQKILLLDMSFFDSQRTGELNSRLNGDVQEFKSSFKAVISQGLRTSAQIIGCMFSLYNLSPKMTLLTFGTLLVIIATGASYGLLLRGLSRRAQSQSAIASSVAEEAFTNIRTVRSFAMEKEENGLYGRETSKAASLHEALGVGIAVFQAGTNLLLNGIVLSILYNGSSLISSGQMSPGDLMSFLATAQIIQKSLSQLSLVFGYALKGYTAGGRVFQLIDLPESTSMADGVCIPYHTLWGEIRFHNVHFAYPTRPDHFVLNGLDLTIPAGRVVALCGPSGEGKTTIVNLLERFYEPNSGMVTLDGKDLRSLNLEWLRGQTISLISQEPVLFATSLMENIRYGKPSATDDEVIEAARMANAHSFISSFPSGYYTTVGERGTQLSGGQKQRIAIARALLKNAPILVLDEATSALDSESERTVKDALDRAIKGKTVLVIAHRMSTIRDADWIIVIRQGKVAEQGTHKQLLANKGPYALLVNTNDSA